MSAQLVPVTRLNIHATLRWRPLAESVAAASVRAAVARLDRAIAAGSADAAPAREAVAQLAAQGALIVSDGETAEMLELLQVTPPRTF